MNSFRFLQRGIEAELERQRELVEAGGTVEQETLHFDPASGSLTSLRSKEEAHDYRYFPEPDLVPLAPTEADAARGPRGAAGAAGGADRALRGELGLAEDVAMTLAGDPATAELLRAGRRRRRGRRAAGRRQLGDRRAGRRAAPGRRGGAAAESKVDPEALAALIGWSRRSRSPTAAARPCWRPWSPRVGSRRRSSSARAWPRWPATTASWPAIVAAAIAADPAARHDPAAGRCAARRGDR